MIKFRLFLAVILLGLVGYANADGLSNTFQLTAAMITTALGFTPPSNALTSTHLFIGNGSNVAADTALSGDVTITNAGVSTVGKVLGVGAGVTATQTISFTVSTTKRVWPCDATAGNVTATLPAATGTGAQYVLKKIDSTANTCIFKGNAAETIDGANTQTLTAQWQSLTVNDAASTKWYAE